VTGDESREPLAEVVRRAFNVPLSPVEQLQRDIEQTRTERQKRQDDANRASVENVDHLRAIAGSLEALTTESRAESKRTRWLIFIAALALAVAVATLVTTLA
jgi:hypothetical protein